MAPSIHCFKLDCSTTHSAAHLVRFCAALVEIKSTFPGKQTDITPSTFGMAGAANNFIGNVAAGSEDSG